MWALKLFLILCFLNIVLQATIFFINLGIVGGKAFGGFRKAVNRYFLIGSLVSTVIAGICVAIQAPKSVTVIAFFASFIGTVFIFLGNDEDNDSFRKL